MKARIRGTEQEIEVFQECEGKWYSPDTREIYDDEQLDFDDFDWEQFRREAAKDILCASLPHFRPDITEEVQVNLSVKLADKLIEKLKEDKQ